MMGWYWNSCCAYTHVGVYLLLDLFWTFKKKSENCRCRHLQDLRVPNNFIVEIGNTVVLVSYDTHDPTRSVLQTGLYVLCLNCGFGEHLKHPPLVDSTATQPMGLHQCYTYHVLAYDLTITMRDGCWLSLMLSLYSEPWKSM